MTDLGRRGFQVRVFPTGQKSFQFRYRFQGVTHRLSLGGYPTVSLAQAHLNHASAAQMLRTGRNPAHVHQALKHAEIEAGTVAELAEEFMRRFVLKARKRPDQVEQMLDANVLPYWRLRKAKDITPRDVTLLLDRIVDRGAKTMANRVAAVVSQMFKFGVQRGLLAGSPCVALQRPGGHERSRSRKLTEEEVKIVWERLDTAALSAPLKIATRLLLVTAQRRGELAKARWRDIDFGQALWTIPAEHSKNGSAHVVPLSDMAVELLRDLQCRTGSGQWLFPSPRGNQTPVIDRSISRGIRNNEEHFGIPHFTPHDLRRTAASMMTMLGAPRLHVSKVLNHTEDSITAVYDRYDYLAEKRTALTAWTNYLADIVCGGLAKVVPLRALGGAH